MKITKEIFQNFLLCPYKAYLLLKGEAGYKSEYEVLFKEIKEKYCADGLKKCSVKYASVEMIRDTNLKDKNGVVYQSRINQQDVHSDSCIMERVRGGSEFGTFHYIPVIFSPKKKLSQEDRFEIAYDGYILETLQSRRPEYGKVICGDGFKTTKLRIGSQIEKINNVVAKIKKINLDSPPRIVLNRHCQICEFKDSCRAKSVEKDDLSLLAGIGFKEIETQNKKGIFTVTQYSYTFRPRKKFKKSYPFNLKALALREKKTHIYGTPKMPASDVQIYLDVEGDPEQDLYYLIGIIIIQNGIEKRFTFWADDQNQESAAFHEFVGHIKKYPEFKLYHYGSYEIKFLQKMRRGLGYEQGQVVDKMLENAINVLSVVYSHVFFPTYSNGLKDIGSYLGFRWTSLNASGIQSLVWRKQFEVANDKTAKSKLIEYNLEDCLALKQVVEFINKIDRDANQKTDERQDVIYADDLKYESGHSKWGRIDFVSEDLEHINKCAYFDYQREKIFVRTNKKLKKIKTYRTIYQSRAYKINKRILLPVVKECFQCKGKIYRHGYYSRRVIDLKFFSGTGVKRWVTIYSTNRARCFQCKKAYNSEGWGNLEKYGHNLISWVMYQNIAGHQPFYRIVFMLDDIFGISVGGSTLQRFKRIFAEYYQETYQGIIDKIKHGHLVHVDETQVSFPGINGYVWVFTSMDEVYFLFTPTREGDFLKELLSEFKGVLVSDFYGAYCSAKWIQQKCLVHLIRDLNDDLRNSPFDEEYKKITNDFSSLLRRIIGTVDEHGLKKRKLSKHKKDVLQFFHDLSCQNYQSELAQKYQKRFQKNQDTLFTFLDYDGIPWNNNNAEHAIKHFAVYRQTMKLSGRFTEQGLKQYLILLSIHQTCRYKGINFLKFLASGKKDIDSFLQN